MAHPMAYPYGPPEKPFLTNSCAGMFFLRRKVAQINQLRWNVILTKRGLNKQAALESSIYENRPK